MNRIWTALRSAYQPCALAIQRPAAVRADCRSSCLLTASPSIRIDNVSQKTRVRPRAFMPTVVANPEAMTYEATVIHPIALGSPIWGAQEPKTQLSRSERFIASSQPPPNQPRLKQPVSASSPTQPKHSGAPRPSLTLAQGGQIFSPNARTCLGVLSVGEQANHPSDGGCTVPNIRAFDRPKDSGRACAHRSRSTAPADEEGGITGWIDYP
jgi:hypothetical protein